MTYVTLTLPKTLPHNVAMFIRHRVEAYLFDARQLLSTAFPEAHPRAQIQRPIALTLLATIAGVSRVLHSRKNAKGGDETFDSVLFPGFVADYYPFDIDPPKDVTPDVAAKILYSAFRCPLVHSLNTDGPDSMPTNIARSPEFITKIGRALRGNSDAERDVEALERCETKPYSEPWLVVRPDATVLWLDALYWGVRKMIERWALDAEQVKLADQKMAERFKTLAHLSSP